MKKSLIILICFLISGLVINLFAKPSDHIGTSTSKLMDIEVDPTVNALGGAYCAYVSDLTGYEANIAGLSELNEKQFLIAYYDWLMDTSLFYGAYAMPIIKKGVIGTSIKFLNIPQFANKNEWGEDSGSINVGDFIYSLGFAYKYTPSWKFGINLKYNRQSYSVDDNDLLAFSSFGIDIGVQHKMKTIRLKKIPLIYDKPYYIKDLQFGLCLQNFGFTSSQDSLPRKIKLGLAYPIVPACSFLFDINKSLYKFNSLFDSDYDFNFGIEYNYKKMIYFRAGMNLGYDMNTFSIGVGFQTKIGSLLSMINYGYNSHEELGHLNNLSLSSRFQRISFKKQVKKVKPDVIEFYYYQGIAYFIEGKLQQAIVEWKKVLQLDPEHTEAKTKIEEAERMLKQQQENQKRSDDTMMNRLK